MFSFETRLWRFDKGMSVLKGRQGWNGIILVLLYFGQNYLDGLFVFGANLKGYVVKRWSHPCEIFVSVFIPFEPVFWHFLNHVSKLLWPVSPFHCWSNFSDRLPLLGLWACFLKPWPPLWWWRYEKRSERLEELAVLDVWRRNPCCWSCRHLAQLLAEHWREQL